MDNLDATQLLALVKDIHLPAAPAAPAIWPMLLTATVILIAIAALIFSRYQKRSTWASQARAELKEIEQQRNPQALEQTASLLKRIALTNDQRNIVKHLSGDNWLRYLDHFFNTRYFTEGDGKVFGKALYEKDTQAPDDLYQNLRKLVNRRKWYQ